MALLFLFLGMLCQVQAQTLSSLTVTPANPTGGTNATGQVTLTAPAPANGLTVSLASSQPGIASVQASVTVASGQTQASFNVTTTSVAAATAVTLSATDGTTPQSAAMTVLPPQVTGFWVRPSTLIGGGSVTGTISLDAAAPTGGLRFSISSSKSQAAFAPATLYVPAGANSFTFSIQTSTVNYPITVTLTEPSSGLTAILSLLPTNLHVVGLLPPHVVQLAWDAQQTTQYRLYRAVYPPNSDADWTLVATLPGSALSCNDAFNFVPGTAYVYVLKTDQALYYSADIVQPYFVAANGNQAVDSRLDLRYATTVFQDHNFGGSAYRGGLFAGFANDPARIGRSFARFPIDSQPAPTLPSFRVGNIAAYLTTAYTTGNSAVQMQVTCQALLSGFWDPMATTWSTAPAVDPNAPKSFAMVQYDPTAPVSQWLTWSLGDTIKQAALNHTPLSVA